MVFGGFVPIPESAFLSDEPHDILVHPQRLVGGTPLLEWYTGFFAAIDHLLPAKYLLYGASNGAY